LLDTFASNTTVTDSKAYGIIGNFQKIILNFINTIVPLYFRNIPASQINMFLNTGSIHLYYLRDYYFVLVQLCLMHAGSFFIAPLLLVLTLKRKVILWEPSAILWVAVVTFLGIAVHGELVHFGLAHICLQALSLLALVWLVVHIQELPLWAVALLVLGNIADFAFGIYLNLFLQGKDLSAQIQWVSDPLQGGLHFNFPEGLPTVVAANIINKNSANITTLGDAIGGAGWYIWLGISLITLFTLVALILNERRLYSRA
jgi:hypothetical protein